MKLNKFEKAELKYELELLKELKGFIHIFEGGITRVYVPCSNSKNNRMFFYGQSVCNSADKYNKKRGMFLALRDYNDSYKKIPLDLIKLEFWSELVLEYIG